MKKMSLKAVAIAVGALVATSAFASVDLDSSSPTVATFASELDYSSATGTAIASNTNTTFTTKLGFGVSGGQNRYIRVDLSGAKFATADTGAGLSIASAGPATFANVTVVAGGQVGDSFVIYQVTAAAGGHAAADIVTDILPSLNITNGNAASVGVIYALYETAVASVNNAPGTSLYTNSGSLLAFGAGLKWTLTTNDTTAAVAQSFKQFSNGVSATTAKIGSFAYGVNAVLKASGAAVALTDLVTAATKATFAGDFTATASASGVFVDNSDNCFTVNAATLNATNTSADFTVGTTPKSANLCYTVNGTTIVPAETVTAALNVTAAAGSTAASKAAATIGTISHDGTELQAPWFSTNASYISRFVLTSQNPTDASYTTTVLLENGNTCTPGANVTGTLKAGQQLVIDATSICSAFAAGANTRAAVVFTIAAPTNKIQGVYNIVNPTTGSVSVSNMVRPGTN